MLSINIDEKEAKSLIHQRIADLVKEVDAELVFWDSNELKRRTCMSWEVIQGTFFFDPRFPKVKVGGKWYYPVKEASAFLETWLREQAS